jgi:hypothetical protein
MKQIIILIITSLIIAACSYDELKRAGYEVLQDVDCERNKGISNCAYDVENRHCWQDSNSEDCETDQDYDTYQEERKRYLNDNSDKD